MEPIFTSFFDVPPTRKRSTWVYGVYQTELGEELVFGSIQGIDLSGKVIQYGIEAFGRCPNHIIWIPDQLLTHDPVGVALIAIQNGFGVNDCREFVNRIESSDWVIQLRKKENAK